MPDSFADKVQTFTLSQSDIAPVGVAVSRWVERPDGVLGGEGPAVMDAAKGESQLVIDFGQETVGTIRIRGEALGETAVTIHYGEDLEEALRTEEFPADWYNMPKDEFALKPGPCVLDNYGRRAFRYVHLRILPGRGKLRIDEVSARFIHYPVTERGAFRCPDGLLGRIWQTRRDQARSARQDSNPDV